MSECWDCIAIGMKVEVQMPEGEGPTDSCWIATIIKICGIFYTYFFHELKKI